MTKSVYNCVKSVIIFKSKLIDSRNQKDLLLEHKQTRTHARIYTYPHIYTHSKNYIHAYRYIILKTHAHIGIHTRHIHTHTHTHTRTHTRTPPLSPRCLSVRHSW